MERRTFLAGTAAGSFAIALNWPAPALAQGGDPLINGFSAPPPDARPHTWWHWMNGNATADGITRDLEAMARVGVGGVQMFDVGCGIPAGPAGTQTPEWVRLVNHAVDECNRLGLSFTLHNCPGWSSSAGPWITPELSMQQLVWSEVTLAGGGMVDRQLAMPLVRLGHYRDAMVIAYPALPGDRTAARGQIVRTTLDGAPIDIRLLVDGDSTTGIDVAPGADPSHLVLEFAAPYRARALTLRATADDSANYASAAMVRIEASDDGRTYRPVGQAPVPVWRLHTNPPIILDFEATSARFFRVSVPTAMRVVELALSADPRIADTGDKAGWGRYVNAGEAPGAADVAIDPESVIDISRFMDADGRLRWDAPDGEWTILRFGHTATGAQNIAAPDAGLGLECDKFSAAALDFHFDQYFSKVIATMERLGKRDLAGAVIDSYEAGMQNWTADLPAEFAARRGYALTRYMPVVTGRVVGDAEVSERFLWDLRRVHALLMEDRYYGRFHDLCRRHGLVSYTEPYGNGPFDDQQAGAKVDSLMGEFWVRGGAAAYSVKVAATTAHVHGKTFIGAESFTGRPAQSRWLEHPYAMKALGDEMYALGLNHFVFHRYAQQPHPTARPGMTMGPWGFHFDRTNTWFDDAGPWLTYAARCQHLLRQGNFVADILYFAGENSPVQVPVHIEEPIAATLSGARPRLPQPVPVGHDYDVADADVLMNRVRIENGEIVLPEGIRYRVLVMPEDRRITRELLAKLAGYVRAGMWLVGPRIDRSHGLAGYPDNDAEVRRLADELWGDLDGKTRTSHAVGRGRVFWGVPLRQVLDTAGLAPDVTISARSADPFTNWIHRRTADADIYFVANGRRRAEDLICTFRVTGRRPELWDPATGKTRALPVYEPVDGGTRVALRLEEAGSCFIVFRHPAENGSAVLAGPAGPVLQTRPYRVPAGVEAAHDFTVTAWIKPETDLWPVTPAIASDRDDPETVAARAEALARVGALETLGRAGTSFLLDPPAGDATFGAGHATLAVSVGRNGVILYENAGASYRAVLALTVPIAGWTHLAVSYASGRPSVFLDGKMVGTGAGASASRVHAMAGFPGARPRYFEGDVEALEIHPRALAAADLAARVAAGVPARADGPPVELADNGLLIWQDGLYTLGARRIEARGIAPATALAGPWQVAFPPDLGAPATITLDRLMSLHRHDDFGVRHFSGTATWRTRVDVPARSLGGGQRVYLDLGRVEVIAAVRVNGRDLGKLWKPPYRLDITDAVRAGTNTIEIAVTNLWPNRLIGDEHFPTDDDYSVKAHYTVGGITALPDWYREGRPQPAGKRIAFTTWRHYDAASPLLESGLIGPVRLLGARHYPLG